MISRVLALRVRRHGAGDWQYRCSEGQQREGFRRRLPLARARTRRYIYTRRGVCAQARPSRMHGMRNGPGCRGSSTRAVDNAGCMGGCRLLYSASGTLKRWVQQPNRKRWTPRARLYWLTRSLGLTLGRKDRNDSMAGRPGTGTAGETRPIVDIEKDSRYCLQLVSRRVLVAKSKYSS
ncbi:hypothetical protein BC628DRAFT_891848 [Trametes gibbosa]|nr:hypothetical protein BC628DRAFT_891848 [Trametes gibbosa]